MGTGSIAPGSGVVMNSAQRWLSPVFKLLIIAIGCLSLYFGLKLSFWLYDLAMDAAYFVGTYPNPLRILGRVALGGVVVTMIFGLLISPREGRSALRALLILLVAIVCVYSWCFSVVIIGDSLGVFWRNVVIFSSPITVGLSIYPVALIVAIVNGNFDGVFHIVFYLGFIFLGIGQIISLGREATDEVAR